MRALLLIVLAAAAAAAAACGPSHRHEPAAHRDQKNRLYVELGIPRSHKGPLREGAKAGLSRIPFVELIPLNHGGDAELQIEVSRLEAVGRETVCTIKILVLRLPEHDLFGMAEGTARAGGTHGQAEVDCIERLGESLVSGKVRAALQKRLAEKR